MLRAKNGYLTGKREISIANPSKNILTFYKILEFFHHSQSDIFTFAQLRKCASIEVRSEELVS